MAYVAKFNYPTVTKESTSEHGRLYWLTTSDGVKHEGLKSVTTILSACMETKAIIQKWRDTVGHVVADEIVRNSSNRGNLMHDILHYRLTEQDYSDKFKRNFLYLHAEKMADSIQTYLDKNMSECYASEEPLVLPTYYAGRVDCIGVYDGTLSVIDFKNSYKEKKIEHMESYFYQCAAYAVAHDYLFNTNIEQAVILICNADDITAKDVIIKGDEFVAYKLKWIDMVQEYVGH